MLRIDLKLHKNLLSPQKILKIITFFILNTFIINPTNQSNLLTPIVIINQSKIHLKISKLVIFKILKKLINHNLRNLSYQQINIKNINLQVKNLNSKMNSLKQGKTWKIWQMMKNIEEKFIN